MDGTNDVTGRLISAAKIALDDYRTLEGDDMYKRRNEIAELLYTLIQALRNVNDMNTPPDKDE